MHSLHSLGMIGSVNCATDGENNGAATRAAPWAVLLVHIQGPIDITACLELFEVVLEQGWLRGRPSQCMSNAFKLVISHIDAADAALQALRAVLSNAGSCHHVLQTMVGG